VLAVTVLVVIPPSTGFDRPRPHPVNDRACN
jgi:hypothetical protein